MALVVAKNIKLDDKDLGPGRVLYQQGLAYINVNDENVDNHIDKMDYVCDAKRVLCVLK